MLTMRKLLPLLSLLIAPVAGCKPQQQNTATTQSMHDDSAAATDTVSGIAAQVRHFREALPGTAPAELTGGAASRDELVMRLVRAVEAKDRATADSMVLNAWEFIEFYYPHTPFIGPPYELDPQHVWLLARADSDKGFRRLFDRYGGDRLNFNGYSCAAEPEQQERNRIWSNCVVRWNPGRGAPAEMALFAAIIEREGQFKFLSYANDF